MASLNKMAIIGHVGGEAEMRYTQSGSPVTNFSVAVNDKRKNAHGESEEKTTWFRVNCWNKLAEVAGQYVKKGMQVYVEGPLTVREFTGSDGQMRFSLEITARDFTMLSGQSSNGHGGDEGTLREPASTTRRNPTQEPIFDKDIPF